MIVPKRDLFTSRDEVCRHPRRVRVEAQEEYEQRKPKWEARAVVAVLGVISFRRASVSELGVSPRAKENHQTEAGISYRHGEPNLASVRFIQDIKGSSTKKGLS